MEFANLNLRCCHRISFSNLEFGGLIIFLGFTCNGFIGLRCCIDLYLVMGDEALIHFPMYLLVQLVSCCAPF